jgi:hypothetical protein
VGPVKGQKGGKEQGKSHIQKIKEKKEGTNREGKKEEKKRGGGLERKSRSGKPKD